MKFVQNFNNIILAITLRELVFLNLKIFIFGKHFFNLFLPSFFTVYILNDSCYI